MPEKVKPKAVKKRIAIQVRIDEDDLGDLLKNALTDVAAQAIVIAVRTFNQLKAKEVA